MWTGNAPFGKVLIMVTETQHDQGTDLMVEHRKVSTRGGKAAVHKDIEVMWTFNLTGITKSQLRNFARRGLVIRAQQLFRDAFDASLKEGATRLDLASWKEREFSLSELLGAQRDPEAKVRRVTKDLESLPADVLKAVIEAAQAKLATIS